MGADLPHDFELRKEVELDATPEQVWEAIATGPGLDSWFMGRNQVEPREGGMTRLALFGQTEESTVVLGHHIFAPGVDREETEQAWQTWLSQLSFG